MFEGMKFRITQSDAMARLERRAQETTVRIERVVAAVGEVAARTTNGDLSRRWLSEVAKWMADGQLEKLASATAETPGELYEKTRARELVRNYAEEYRYAKRVADAIRAVKLAPSAFEVDFDTITFIGD